MEENHKQKKWNLNAYKRDLLKWDTYLCKKNKTDDLFIFVTFVKNTEKNTWSDSHLRIKNYHVCLQNAPSPDSQTQWGHKILECLFRIQPRPCSWLIVTISAKKKIDFLFIRSSGWWSTIDPGNLTIHATSSVLQFYQCNRSTFSCAIYDRFLTL